MAKKYYPPFIVIPMPLDSEGRGPALEDETVKTIWEIWDISCQTVSSHDSEGEAMDKLVELKKEYEVVP